MGARGGMIAPDDKTFEYIKGREFTPKAEAWEKAMQYWETSTQTKELNLTKNIILMPVK